MLVRGMVDAAGETLSIGIEVTIGTTGHPTPTTDQVTDLGMVPRMRTVVAIMVRHTEIGCPAPARRDRRMPLTIATMIDRMVITRPTADPRDRRRHSMALIGVLHAIAARAGLDLTQVADHSLARRAVIPVAMGANTAAVDPPLARRADLPIAGRTIEEHRAIVARTADRLAATSAALIAEAVHTASTIAATIGTMTAMMTDDRAHRADDEPDA